MLERETGVRNIESAFVVCSSSLSLIKFDGLSKTEIALANDYGFYRLSCERDGACGHARALLEELCLVAGPRVCGAIWRQGPGAVGADATQGHWLGATHISAGYSWRRHEWVVKDSIGSTAKSVTAEAIMCFLDEAEKRRMDFGIIVDLR